MNKICFSIFSIVLSFSLSAQSSPQTEQPRDTVSQMTQDSSELYGLISQLPVKVGGGPADQRKYLERLRDAQGKKVNFSRLHSCCPYETKSPQALFGGGMLDVY